MFEYGERERHKMFSAPMQRQAILAGLSVATFAFLVRIPTLAEPRWYYDEGIFTTVAWASSKGMTLYVDVIDLQPPGIHWLSRLLLGAGAGEHHLVTQVAVSALAVGSSVLTLALARRWMNIWPATLAGLLTGFGLSLPAFDGDLLNVDLAALPFLLASLVLAFSSRSVIVLFSGALMGVALIFRPSFLVDSLALLVPLLSYGRRELRLLMAGLGSVAVLGVAAGALWLQGSLEGYLNVVAPIDDSYLLDANRGSWGPILVRLLVFGVIAAAAFVRARSTGGRFIALLLPASLAGSTLTPKGYAHFVQEAIPPLALGLAMVAGRYRLRWLSAPIAAVALVVLGVGQMTIPELQTALMTGYPPKLARDSLGFDIGYYSNWFAYATLSKSYPEYSAWFPDVVLRRRELDQIRSAGSVPGDTLQLIGPQPWLYVESGLLPGSPYLSATDIWGRPVAKDKILRTLRDGCADVVVAVTDLATWQDALSAGGYVPVDGAAWPTFQSSRPHQVCS
jgi:hypothetical protein